MIWRSRTVSEQLDDLRRELENLIVKVEELEDDLAVASDDVEEREVRIAELVEENLALQLGITELESEAEDG